MHIQGAFFNQDIPQIFPDIPKCFQVIYPLVNQHNYGKSPCFMGQSTIDDYKCAICNSKLQQFTRVYQCFPMMYPSFRHFFATLR